MYRFLLSLAALLVVFVLQAGAASAQTQCSGLTVTNVTPGLTFRFSADDTTGACTEGGLNGTLRITVNVEAGAIVPNRVTVNILKQVGGVAVDSTGVTLSCGAPLDHFTQAGSAVQPAGVRSADGTNVMSNVPCVAQFTDGGGDPVTAQFTVTSAVDSPPGGPTTITLSVSSITYTGGVFAAAAGQVQDALVQRGAALLGAQPDLRSRGQTGGARFNAQVTQGIGFVDLDTGGGPVWLAVTGQWSDTGPNSTHFGLATLGLQTETGAGVVGALVQIDDAVQTGAAGARIAARGLSAGPFVVQRLAGGLTFDARLLAGRTRNDITRASGLGQANGVTGSRVLATAQISGAMQFDSGLSFAPRASVGYVRETVEGFTIGASTVAEQRHELGEAVLGGDLRVPVTEALALTFGLAAHWAFQQTATGGTVTTPLPDQARGRIDLGAQFQQGGLNAQVGLYQDGVGATGHTARGASVSLNWAF